jgi:hypothetical protein
MLKPAFILTMALTVALLAALAPSLHGKGLSMPDPALHGEARKGFEQILDLWRDGKYGELYDRTTGSGKESRERFADRLADAPLKPACCWEKMQDVTVIARHADTVTIRARIGLEGGMGSEYRTRSFRLVREDGVWKASRSDILELSGGAKKKKRQTVWK